MPATPATARRKSGGRHTLPADLKPFADGYKVLFVPRSVFPKEKVPRGFQGWEARVAGVEGMFTDGLHVQVEFDGYPDVYHFPLAVVRQWTAHERPTAGPAASKSPAKKSAKKASGGAAAAAAALEEQAAEQEQEEEEEEWQEQRTAPASARKSARKGASAAAGSSRTPATAARRRSAAAQGAAAQEQAAPSTARRTRRAAAEEEVQEHALPSSQPRKRKASTDSGAARQKRQQAGPSWIDSALDAAKQAVVSAGAVGVCYGLLKALYPLVDEVAP